MFERPLHSAIPLALAGSLLLPACGGAQGPGAAAPCPTVTAAAPAASGTAAAAAAKGGPPPFTGTFELVKGTDGKTTVDFSEVIHKGALDGKILWTVGNGTFTLGVWILGSMKEKDDDGAELYSLCRGAVTVTARYDGATMALPTALDVKGWSTAVRVLSKRDAAAGKTTTRTWQSNMSCSASLGTDPVTLEVLEKDADGPVKLRARAGEGTFELVRAASIDTLDPKEIVRNAPRK